MESFASSKAGKLLTSPRRLFGPWLGGSIKECEDFLICLKPSRRDGSSAVSYIADTSWQRHTFKSNVSLAQSQLNHIQKMLHTVQQWRPWPNLEPSVPELEDIGSRLLNLLLPTPEQQALLIEALQQAKSEGKNLRLCLVIDSNIQPGALLLLPWEFLYDERVGFLALLPFVSFTRQTKDKLAKKSTWVWLFGKTTRILIIVSNPKDPQGFWPCLNVLPELEGVCDALQLKLSPRRTCIEVVGIEELGPRLKERLESRGIKVLPGRATIKNLQRILSRKRKRSLLWGQRQKYDVVHYIGHGFFLTPERYKELEESNNVPTHMPVEGAGLVLEPEKDHPSCWGPDLNYLFVKAAEKSSPDLFTLLRAASTRLAVLNACEQAAHGLIQRAGRQELLSVARTLVEADIPAVVAMQFPVRDQSARYFAEAFYWEWARYRSVDSGVREARQLLGGILGDKFDWGAPVLYAAQLFQFSFIKMLAAAGTQITGFVGFLILVIALPLWWALTPDIRLVFGPLIHPSWRELSMPLPIIPPIRGNAELSMLRLKDDQGSYLRITCHLEREKGAYCQWGINWGIAGIPPFNLEKQAPLVCFMARGAAGIVTGIDRQVRFQVLFKDIQGRGNEGSEQYYEFPSGGAWAQKPDPDDYRYYIYLPEANRWVTIRIPLTAVEQQDGGKLDLSRLHDLTIRIDSSGYTNSYKGLAILDVRPFSFQCATEGEKQP